MARPRTFDESLILGRAREAFHDHGYTATSVERLTAATGLRRSSLYGAFGDKHSLFLRSFGQYCEQDSAAIRRELAGDALGATRRLERHMRAKTSDPIAARRGCMLAKTAAELASTDPDILQMASEFYADYERALIDCVRAAQAVGDLRLDIDARDAGAMLLAVLRGIEALGRTSSSAAALQVMITTTLASLAPVSAP